MINIDREKGRFILSGEATDIIADIAIAISLAVENVPEEIKLGVAGSIYYTVTDENSPLWDGTGVTVEEIKAKIAEREKKESFSDFIRRFRSGKI